jgi:spore coat protein U-like protein
MQSKTRFTRSTVAAALIVALATVSGTAVAAATDTMTVTATVVASCSLSVTGDIAFGNYDAIGANATTPLDAQGEITTTCSAGSTPKISLDAGTGTATAPVHAMSDGTNSLPYKIYTDATYATEWGSDPATNEVSPTADGTAQTTAVYGRIAAGNTTAVVSTGYTDTVTATVTF